MTETLLHLLALLAATVLPPGPPPCMAATGAVYALRAGSQTYAAAWTCGEVLVHAAETGTSALRDLHALAHTSGYADLTRTAPLALVLKRPTDPVTAQDDWPTPPGNLYLALHLGADPATAARLAAEAAATVLRRAAPGRAFAVTVDEAGGAAYAGVRLVGADRRFVAGVSALPMVAKGRLAKGERAGGALVGIDLHLGALAAAYGSHAKEHVSLVELGVAAPRLEVAVAAVLAGLRPHLRVGTGRRLRTAH